MLINKSILIVLSLMLAGCNVTVRCTFPDRSMYQDQTGNDEGADPDAGAPSGSDM